MGFLKKNCTRVVDGLLAQSMTHLQHQIRLLQLVVEKDNSVNILQTTVYLYEPSQSWRGNTFNPENIPTTAAFLVHDALLGCFIAEIGVNLPWLV